ncbi:MAG TPA: metalloregulator ArsR/SmtB family transcription factor [Marinagarivorans sp.]
MTPLAFYKCLAEQTRLKSLLLITLERELCVCDLVRALDMSQPKISRHLAELRKCGIVLDEKRGTWVYYRLHPELPEWAEQVLQLTAVAERAFITDEIKKLHSCANHCA